MTRLVFDGDHAQCAEALPLARRALRTLEAGPAPAAHKRLVGPESQEIFVELNKPAGLSRITIKAVDEVPGILVTPASYEHQNGWGAPFSVAGTPINPPLGTPRDAGDRNRVLLEATDKKVPDSLLKAKSRGLNLKAGNITVATPVDIAKKQYDIVSFDGPPSLWTYDDSFSTDKGFRTRSVPPKGPTDYSAPYVYVGGRRIDAPAPVLAARFVRKALPSGKTEKRLYVLTLGYLGLTVGYTTNLGRTWTTVGAIAIYNDESYLTNSKYYGGYTEANGPFPYYSGYLAMYSRPDFKLDGSEVSFLLVSQNRLDRSLGGDPNRSWSTYFACLQKYHGKIVVGDSGLTYSITRLDADQGSDVSDHSGDVSGVSSRDTHTQSFAMWWVRFNSFGNIVETVDGTMTITTYTYDRYMVGANQEFGYLELDHVRIKTPEYVHYTDTGLEFRYISVDGPWTHNLYKASRRDYDYDGHGSINWLQIPGFIEYGSPPSNGLTYEIYVTDPHMVPINAWLDSFGIGDLGSTLVVAQDHSATATFDPDGVNKPLGAADTLKATIGGTDDTSNRAIRPLAVDFGNDAGLFANQVFGGPYETVFDHTHYALHIGGVEKTAKDASVSFVTGKVMANKIFCGAVHDPRTGSTLFSAKTAPATTDPTDYDTINWVSNGTLEHIVGTDTGAPTDTKVQFFPISLI